MDRGRVREVGTPQQIHRRPRSSFTARFVGSNNVFDVEVLSKEPPVVRCHKLVLRCGDLGSAQLGDKLNVVIAAEELHLSRASADDNQVTRIIRLKTFMDRSLVLSLR